MQRPLQDVIGKIAPEQLERLKAQILRGVLSIVRGEEMQRSISAYLTDTLAQFRPHSIDSIMRTLHPESEEKLKSMLSKGLLSIISSDETSKVINDMLARQIEGLLNAPIGKLSDSISEETPFRRRCRGRRRHRRHPRKTPRRHPRIQRRRCRPGKDNELPGRKTRSPRMSVAKEHLRTIELFGALFGFIIGVLQSIQFYIYAR